MKFEQALNEKIKFDKKLENYVDTDLESYKDLMAARKGKKPYGLWIRPVRMKING